MRLLRSASLHYMSQSVEFMPPNLQTEEKFTEMAKNANMGEITIQTCQELDDIFNNLGTSFSKKTDYLKVLVKTFQKSIKTPENQHLQYFYILLPSVTINYVDHILMAKERLSKANPHEAFFFVRPLAAHPLHPAHPEAMRPRPHSSRSLAGTPNSLSPKSHELPESGMQSHRRHRLGSTRRIMIDLRLIHVIFAWVGVRTTGLSSELATS